uniref:DIS3-like exonuclease 2 n=1 Tax=Populus trichocarpa TaxID=3694 RepID=A0A3N7GG35_POPTR
MIWFLFLIVTRAAFSQPNEPRGESSLSVGNGGKTKCSRQLELDANPIREHGPTTASGIVYSSMPTMHANEQLEDLVPSDRGGSMLAKPCPESIVGGGLNGKSLPFHQFEGQAQSKIFAPYWSMETVNEALEKGDVFKVLFRVNAHNRLEAYCKIEGVPTDLLISGIAVQNRAVEGDVVVIEVDPLSFWTKMKGSNEPSNNLSTAEDSNLHLEANGKAGGSRQGKIKLNMDCKYADFGNSLVPHKGFYYGYSSCAGEDVHDELNGPVGYNYANGYHQSPSDSSHVAHSMGQSEVLNGVGRMCSMISSYPSKRPTCRVVAIIEKSPRRDAIIGFLNVKQWFYYKEGCKKDAKKNKSLPSISNCEYIEIMPADPRFPKLMVLVSSLPNCIKKRLEDEDETVEMEMVAAQIDKWSDESPFPEAHVSYIFGRGSEMESQINAILHENAVCCSEFSPESLSCLPSNTWEVPEEEFQNRRDLRNLCIFTIDPSIATDLDDALSVQRLPNGLVRVGVHITDVSYFVLPDTALDKEAQIRSTSVYMSQRKIPMLPPLLSKDVGSLNPGVDRLAFSIFWNLNSSGNVVDRWIGRTVIRSCCKLSYEHAREIFDGMIDAETHNNFRDLPQLHGHFEWADVIGSIKCLHEISKTLREKRFDDGALQLESCKIVFSFDKHGVPYDNTLCGRKDSNFLVEEFMLLANRTAAEIISRAFPDNALLRRHPEPNIQKLKEFEAFCCKHGLELDTSSGNFRRSLEHIKEKLKDDSVLFNILINYASRPMQLATYFCSGDLKDNMNDWGHYALAVPLYTHFTSPLRRYPDIVVHRTLAAAIEAEQLYMMNRRMSHKVRPGEEVTRCFTGICFLKDAAGSSEGREALSAAALKHRIPCTKLLTDVAAYSNERKLASRHVKDACDKLYMWVSVKRKEVLLSDARVLGLGPRFMSIYIHKLAFERRIYYDEVEGLTVEWLEATSTLVLSIHASKCSARRAGPGYYRALDEVAWVINPCDHNMEPDMESTQGCHAAQHSDPILKSEIDPFVFPLTVRLLSTIPVALHATGGDDDGPRNIGARLFMSSYFT